MPNIDMDNKQNYIEVIRYANAPKLNHTVSTHRNLTEVHLLSWLNHISYRNVLITWPQLTMEEKLFDRSEADQLNVMSLLRKKKEK